MIIIQAFFFFKVCFYWLKRQEGRETETLTSCFLQASPLGIKPSTTGNQTSDLPVHGTTLNQPNHPSWANLRVLVQIKLVKTCKVLTIEPSYKYMMLIWLYKFVFFLSSQLSTLKSMHHPFPTTHISNKY